MNKLLSADFARLGKDTFFRIGMVFMFIIGIFRPVSIYCDMVRWELTVPFDGGFFVYVVFVVILASVFCSLFIGTEYSDGTIRNKLIVGHKRSHIYLSNLVLSLVASSCMCAAYLIPDFCVGVPLLGFFTTDIRLVLNFMGCIFILSIAFAAVFTMISMLSQSKSTAAVICILGVFILLFIGIYLINRINEPEYYSSAFYMTEEGEILSDPSMLNPSYVRGVKRQIFTFLTDFLPGAQVVQLSADADENVHLGLMSAYSLIIALTATAFGIFFFQKKDIK